MLQKIDHFVHKHIILFSLLILLILLRIPNFFEPYWYGDEGIYLTLGTAMRHGERLYLEIIDHKTPIIYYLAMVPTQFDFRVLNVAGTILTTSLFYFFTRKLIKNRAALFGGLLFFVLLTSLPWFEGPIPNGELFVMCFVMIAATLFAKTQLFQRFFGLENETPLGNGVTFAISGQLISLKQLLFFFTAGVFFSLGVLTKFPGLLDALGFFFIIWLFFTDTLFSSKLTQKPSLLFAAVIAGIGMFVGLVVPVLLSIIYYVLRGSGQAYLDYGLLYNFHYVESWVPNFTTPFLNKLFTLPGKAALLAVLLVIVTALSKFFSNRFRFFAGWFCLALFSCLLSNRPYPHYFLQLMPPLALLVAYGIETVLGILQQWQTSSLRAKLNRSGELICLIALGMLFPVVLHLLGVGVYSNIDYYSKFYKLVTHQISPIQYRDSFNALDSDNYKAAAIIRTSSDQRMFVWGTDPMLYALSGKSPTGRFTVAFHIYDFHAEGETLQDVEQRAPEYVAVLKNEKPFPQLQAYLEQYYIPNTQFQYFILWKRE